MSDSKLIMPEARRLFLDGKSAGEILKIFPQLSSSTLYKWINRYKWNELRDTKMDNYTRSPEIMLEILESLIKRVEEMLLNPVLTVEQKASSVAKLADSISKIVKSIQSMSKDKDRLSAILFTIEQLGKFMSASRDKHLYDDEFRTKFDKMLGEFGSEMLKIFSPKNMGS